MQYAQNTTTGHPNAPINPCTTGDEGCAVPSDGVHVLVRQGRHYQDDRQPNSTEWTSTSSGRTA
jgi:hypothetical protein